MVRQASCEAEPSLGFRTLLDERDAGMATNAASDPLGVSMDVLWYGKEEAERLAWRREQG